MRWRLRHAIAVCALLALVQASSAAELKVRENPVGTNSYAAVALTGTEPGDNVAWDVYPEPTVIDDIGDGRLFFNGPQGTKYRVTADVVNFDKKTRKKYRVDVTIGVEKKEDKKDDKKDPPPGPAPVKADKVWVFVVEDATVPRSIETAKFLNDPYWQTVKPKHDWRHYRSDSSTAIQAGYVNEAKAVGYPAVIILDAKDGAVLKKFKSNSAIEVDAAVKEVAK